MIKHRFIVSETDYRVFAAIPSESKLLTWKKWRRAPDWAKLRELYDESISTFAGLSSDWRDVADGYISISKTDFPTMSDIEQSEFEKEERRKRVALATENIITAGTYREAVDLIKAARERLDHVTDDTVPERWNEIFVKDTETREKLLDQMNVLIHRARRDRDYYENMILDKKSRFSRNLHLLDEAEQVSVLETTKIMYEAHDVLVQLFTQILDKRLRILDIGKEVDVLASPPLPADLECPVGVPFAAYTVELGNHVVVDVVEGHAWIENRQETESEVRATEIVSQMLVERGLNPKAPTRISVREVDPHHAAQTHEAEARPGPPRVRTIKFYVSPPRYLREAAEIILTSPRRAHWVVGHWRNQPFGEGHTMRRQTWIKPHIRGLGEAGATTTKVVATPAQKEGHS